jgi:hypothetical protein
VAGNGRKKMCDVMSLNDSLICLRAAIARCRCSVSGDFVAEVSLSGQTLRTFDFRGVDVCHEHEQSSNVRLSKSWYDYLASSEFGNVHGLKTKRGYCHKGPPLI